MAMFRTEPRPLTVHDYRELPEGPPYYQLIEGELYMSPAPNRFHQEILNNISYLLRDYLESHPVGKIYFAPFDIFLTDLNAYQPDLVFISHQRKSILTEQGAEGAPDLVIEILSPKTAKLDKGVKKEIYARTGVTEMWIIDPELKHLQLFRFEESSDVPVATFTPGQEFKPALFPKLSISVAKIFAQ